MDPMWETLTLKPRGIYEVKFEVILLMYIELDVNDGPSNMWYTVLVRPRMSE